MPMPGMIMRLVVQSPSCCVFVGLPVCAGVYRSSGGVDQPLSAMGLLCSHPPMVADLRAPAATADAVLERCEKNVERSANDRGQHDAGEEAADAEPARPSEDRGQERRNYH